MFFFVKLMKLCFRKSMDTHCPFGLRPIGPCTNWSFVQLDHLLIGHVYSPPKMNWTGLAHGQSAQLTPLLVGVILPMGSPLMITREETDVMKNIKRSTNFSANPKRSIKARVSSIRPVICFTHIHLDGHEASLAWVFVQKALKFSCASRILSVNNCQATKVNWISEIRSGKNLLSGLDNSFEMIL